MSMHANFSNISNSPSFSRQGNFPDPDLNNHGAYFSAPVSKPNSYPSSSSSLAVNAEGMVANLSPNSLSYQSSSRFVPSFAYQPSSVDYDQPILPNGSPRVSGQPFLPNGSPHVGGQPLSNGSPNGSPRVSGQPILPNSRSPGRPVYSSSSSPSPSLSSLPLSPELKSEEDRIKSSKYRIYIESKDLKLPLLDSSVVIPDLKPVVAEYVDYIGKPDNNVTELDATDKLFLKTCIRTVPFLVYGLFQATQNRASASNPSEKAKESERLKLTCTSLASILFSILFTNDGDNIDQIVLQISGLLKSTENYTGDLTQPVSRLIRSVNPKDENQRTIEAAGLFGCTGHIFVERPDVAHSILSLIHKRFKKDGVGFSKNVKDALEIGEKMYQAQLQAQADEKKINKSQKKSQQDTTIKSLVEAIEKLERPSQDQGLLFIKPESLKSKKHDLEEVNKLRQMIRDVIQKRSSLVDIKAPIQESKIYESIPALKIMRDVLLTNGITLNVKDIPFEHLRNMFPLVKDRFNLADPDSKELVVRIPSKLKSEEKTVALLNHLLDNVPLAYAIDREAQEKLVKSIYRSAQKEKEGKQNGGEKPKKAKAAKQKKDGLEESDICEFKFPGGVTAAQPHEIEFLKMIDCTKLSTFVGHVIEDIRAKEDKKAGVVKEAGKRMDHVLTISEADTLKSTLGQWISRIVLKILDLSKKRMGTGSPRSTITANDVLGGIDDFLAETNFLSQADQSAIRNELRRATFQAWKILEKNDEKRDEKEEPEHKNVLGLDQKSSYIPESSSAPLSPPLHVASSSSSSSSLSSTASTSDAKKLQALGGCINPFTAINAILDDYKKFVGSNDRYVVVSRDKTTGNETKKFSSIHVQAKVPHLILNVFMEFVLKLILRGGMVKDKRHGHMKISLLSVENQLMTSNVVRLSDGLTYDVKMK